VVNPTQPKPRRATRARSADQGSERRQDILDTAAACFAATGYRGTSMRAIADASGLLAGSLYSHFKSKGQMLDELMTSFFRELLPRQQAAFDLEGSVGDRLAAMLTEVVDVCQRHREVVMVIEVDWHDIVNTPDLDHVVANGRETSLLFRRLFEEGVRSGEVRDDIDLDCVVRLIHSAIYGLLDQRFRLTGRDGKAVNTFSAEQVASTLIELLAGGLLRQPAKAPARKAVKKTVAKAVKKR
jgi:AcrR family transcriptional regulator